MKYIYNHIMDSFGIYLIVKLDTLERLENTLAVSEYLAANFKANIYLWEIAPYQNGILENLLPGKVKYTFCKDEDPILHRTNYINRMVSTTSDKYLAIWDVDVIVPIPQVIAALQLLCKGVDFVYPYERYFYDTSEELRKLYLETKNLVTLMEYRAFMNELYAPHPVGGVFMAERESYEKSGMENEAFYGWGIEDGERFQRWLSMGMTIKRINGPLFHFSHPRGINSYLHNEDDTLIKRRLRISASRGKRWNNI